MSMEPWNQGAAPTQIQTVSAGVVKLVDYAKESDAAYQLAQRFVVTSFCPAQFREKPEEAAVAMMAGSEIGLSPLAALGAFDVISGRAAARAITLRAVALSRGHDIVLVESSDTKCKIKGKRLGSSEWQTIIWTIDRAKLAGFYAKNPNWRTQPAAMLIARATSEVARLIASDALLGLGGGYSSEELADGDYPAAPSVQVVQAPQEPRRTLSYTRPAQAPVEAQEVAQDAEVIDAETGEVTEPAPAQRRTLTRRRPTQEPDPVEEKQAEIRDLKDELKAISDEAAPDEPVSTTRDPNKLTTAQRGKILAMFTGLEITGHDDRVAYMTKIVGHPVDSTNHLSKWDAHVIIEHLELISDPIEARNQINDEGAIEVSEDGE